MTLTTDSVGQVADDLKRAKSDRKGTDLVKAEGRLQTIVRFDQPAAESWSKAVQLLWSFQQPGKSSARAPRKSMQTSLSLETGQRSLEPGGQRLVKTTFNEGP